MWHYSKGQEVSQIIRMHPLGTMNIHTKLNANVACS